MSVSDLVHYLCLCTDVVFKSKLYTFLKSRMAKRKWKHHQQVCCLSTMSQ